MTLLRRNQAAIIKAFLVPIVFILVPIFSFGDGQAYRQDRLIADVYLTNAIDEYNNGLYLSALRLVDAALSFDGNLSDAVYLRAMLLFKEKKYLEAMEDVKNALILDDFKYFDSVDARIFLSRIQFLTADASSAYFNLVPYLEEISLNSDYAKLFVAAANVLGKYDTALDMARKFTQEGFAQKLLVERDFSWRRRAVFKILEGDVSNFYTKEAYQAIITRNPGPYFPKLMYFYSQRWGKDRFYLINSLGLKETPVLSVLKELFTEDGKLEIFRQDIHRIKQLLDLQNIRYDSGKFFADKTFTILDDRNNDSIADVKTVIEKGFPVTVNFDENQDGVPEYRLVFSKEKKTIEEVVIDRVDKISIEYLYYPYISGYEVESKGKKRNYKIFPYSIKYKLVDIPEDPVLDIIKIDTTISQPSDFALEVNSSSFKEVNMESNESFFADRVNIYNTIVSLINEKGKKFKKLTFTGTAVNSAEQDIDGDGISDLFYKYKDGEISSLSFDGNHNGNFEYQEMYLPTWEQKWDLDDDGIFDVKEYFENGVKIRKFSTKMDGIFDYTERSTP